VKVGHYQASNKRNPLQQCDGFFAVCRKVISKAKRLFVNGVLVISSAPTSNKKNPLNQCNGFFSVWGLVNSQNPMPNSVAAADAYPVLNGILIPIHYA
jgi:hypothetical protein